MVVPIVDLTHIHSRHIQKVEKVGTTRFCEYPAGFNDVLSIVSDCFWYPDHIDLNRIEKGTGFQVYEYTKHYTSAVGTKWTDDSFRNTLPFTA